jgi:hypothetical protein
MPKVLGIALLAKSEPLLMMTMTTVAATGDDMSVVMTGGMDAGTMAMIAAMIAVTTDAMTGAMTVVVTVTGATIAAMIAPIGNSNVGLKNNGAGKNNVVGPTAAPTIVAIAKVTAKAPGLIAGAT